MLLVYCLSWGSRKLTNTLNSSLTEGREYGRRSSDSVSSVSIVASPAASPVVLAAGSSWLIGPDSVPDALSALVLSASTLDDFRAVSSSRTASGSWVSSRGGYGLRGATSALVDAGSILTVSISPLVCLSKASASSPASASRCLRSSKIMMHIRIIEASAVWRSTGENLGCEQIAKPRSIMLQTLSSLRIAPPGPDIISSIKFRIINSTTSI
jgi:hypothetical protein